MMYLTRKGARALWGAILICALGSPAWAKLVNITTPEYPVTSSSPGVPDGFGPEQAIDRNPATMFRAPLRAGAGITIAMPTPVIVKAIRLSSGQDNPAGDPSSYSIEGSMDGVNFIVLGSGDVPAFRSRLMPQTFTFDNSEPYSYYRVSFASVRDASAVEFVSIGEIELLAEVGDDPDRLMQRWFSEYAVGGGSGMEHAISPGGPGGGGGGSGDGSGGGYPTLDGGGHDNTVVVPEPGSFTLAASLGAMLLQARPRRKTLQ